MPQSTPFDQNSKVAKLNDGVREESEVKDQLLLQILSMCTRCEDMYTDNCDQVIYTKQMTKKRLQLVPDELLAPDRQAT